MAWYGRRYFGGGTSQKPTHLMLDPSGNLMQAKEGVLTKEEFVQLVKDGLDAVDLEWSGGGAGSDGPGGAGAAAGAGGEPKRRPAPVNKLAKGASATPPWSGIFEADDPVRRATIEELFALGDDALVVKLYRQLRDVDQKAKVEFLRMAAKEGHRPALPMFVEGLEDKDEAVRNHAAVSIEISRLGDAVAPLLKAVRKEKDERVVADLVRALGACAHADDAALEAVLKYSRGSGPTWCGPMRMSR